MLLIQFRHATHRRAACLLDIHIPMELRDVALSLKAGGIGYYPQDQFVHIDTRKVRHWGAQRIFVMQGCNAWTYRTRSYRTRFNPRH